MPFETLQANSHHCMRALRTAILVTLLTAIVAGYFFGTLPTP
jgi:hypothetical protein